MAVAHCLLWDAYIGSSRYISALELCERLNSNAYVENSSHGRRTNVGSGTIQYFSAADIWFPWGGTRESMVCLISKMASAITKITITHYHSHCRLTTVRKSCIKYENGVLHRD